MEHCKCHSNIESKQKRLLIEHLIKLNKENQKTIKSVRYIVTEASLELNSLLLRKTKFQTKNTFSQMKNLRYVLQNVLSKLNKFISLQFPRSFQISLDILTESIVMITQN